MKLDPNASDRFSGHWAQLVKDTPHRTDKRKGKGGRQNEND